MKRRAADLNSLRGENGGDSACAEFSAKVFAVSFHFVNAGCSKNALGRGKVNVISIFNSTRAVGSSDSQMT